MEEIIEILKAEKYSREREKVNYFWKTKEGNKINIRDLSDKHLDNILKFYEKCKKDEEKYENASYHMDIILGYYD